MLATVAAEIRYALRALRKARVFTTISVLSLGMGIGATTTMVAIIDALYFRPLAYRNSDRVVVLEEVAPPDSTGSGNVPSGASATTFDEWRTQTRRYEKLAALRIIAVQLRGAENGTIDQGGLVDASFFSVLGATPELGRTFTDEEVNLGARVVVVSHDVWQTQYGGDPHVIGATLRTRLLISGTDPVEAYTIIGVMPRGASFPGKTKVWIPLRWSSLGDRSVRRLLVFGLLRPGNSGASANAELKAIARHLAAEYPGTMRGWSAQVTPLRDWMVGVNPSTMSTRSTTVRERERDARLVLLAVAGLVLLLAAANVGNLFITRALGRQTEMVVRAALGATRARIVRLTLIESFLVGLASCALGMWVASSTLEIAGAQLGLGDVGVVAHIDARIMSLAFILALATSLIAGLLPAVKLFRDDLHVALRARTAMGGRRTRAGISQSLMIVTQISLALVLVSGAGLLGRDFIALIRHAPGYDPKDLIAITVPPTVANQPGAHPIVEGAVERVRQTPGVSGAVEHATGLHGDNMRTETGRVLVGGTFEADGVGSDFFRVLRIPMVAGRAFTPDDRAGAPSVVVVNHTAARLLWPGQEAVGRRLFLADSTSGTGGTWLTVVGVTEDFRLLEDPRSAVTPAIYRPFVQSEAALSGWLTIFARMSGDPVPHLPAFERMVAEIHTGAGWQGWGARVVARELDDYLVTQRLSATILTGFSAFGLLLAAMGVYGVVAAGVARRTNEIGIRVTLGAGSTEVVLLVSRQGAKLAAVGVIAGIAGSLALSRALRSVLTVTSPTDPLVLGGAVVLLVGVVLLAGYLPTRRAVRLDPVVALRAQ